MEMNRTKVTSTSEHVAASLPSEMRRRRQPDCSDIRSSVVWSTRGDCRRREKPRLKSRLSSSYFNRVSAAAFKSGRAAFATPETFPWIQIEARLASCLCLGGSCDSRHRLYALQS